MSCNLCYLHVIIVTEPVRCCHTCTGIKTITPFLTFTIVQLLRTISQNRFIISPRESRWKGRSQEHCSTRHCCKLNDRYLAPAGHQVSQHTADVSPTIACCCFHFERFYLVSPLYYWSIGQIETYCKTHLNDDESPLRSSPHIQSLNTTCTHGTDSALQPSPSPTPWALNQLTVTNEMSNSFFS